MDWNFGHIYASFFGADVIIAPEYLAVTLAIAFGIYLWRRPGVGFLGWAMPARIYRDPSMLVDLKIFAFGRLLHLLGLFNRIAGTTAVAVVVAVWVGAGAAEVAQVPPYLSAVMIFVMNDFIAYWLHRVFHHQPYLWRLHMLHHSAEVMSPVTVYRQHPLADIIAILSQSLAFGLAQGLFIGFFAREMHAAEIAGVNVVFFVFVLITANFRHSHIWIRFGWLLEHVFISPAQHQIHHSIAPQHRDKNFGENFALWDWMFGSLYIPTTHEVLTLGLVDGDERPIPQRYTSFRSAMVLPVADMLSLWRGREQNARDAARQEEDA